MYVHYRSSINHIIRLYGNRKLSEYQEFTVDFVQQLANSVKSLETVKKHCRQLNTVFGLMDEIIKFVPLKHPPPPPHVPYNPQNRQITMDDIIAQYKRNMTAWHCDPLTKPSK